MIRSPQARRYIRQLNAEALNLEQQPAAINGQNTPGTEDADLGNVAGPREGLEKGSVSGGCST